MGLFEEATARLDGLLPHRFTAVELPASLAGLAVVVLDGKKIKGAAKRLLPVRGTPGKVYGGKLLAALVPASGLVVRGAAFRDGAATAAHPPADTRPAGDDGGADVRYRESEEDGSEMRWGG